MGNLHLHTTTKNMAKTERSSILLRMTFVILILAFWIGTTSAGQKCTKKGTKCVDFKDRKTGKSYTNNVCRSLYRGKISGKSPMVCDKGAILWRLDWLGLGM